MNQKGFTVIELMISIAIVAIFVVIVAGAMGNHNNSGQAEATAREFVVKMYDANNPRASCMDRDSDADGYVSCTVVYDENNGTKSTVPLLCAANFSLNKGCKLTLYYQPR